MFRSLKLKSAYFSDSENLAEGFFIPVLKNAVKFDRVSAYFSAKSLALYAEGLEFFGKAGHCYRLVISKDVSETDFEEIKNGYKLKDSLSAEMISALREELSLSEERKISNLAYLISLGIVDIKIAFKKIGIMHDKCGIITDEQGNVICFRGSYNATQAAAIKNYESFFVTCSWLDCDGFYLSGIAESEKQFSALWNNRKDGMCVLPAQNVIIREIARYNKGKLIVDDNLLQQNALILDYDGSLKLFLNIENTEAFLSKGFYKFNLKNKAVSDQNGVICFKEHLTYIDYVNIEKKLKERAPSLGYSFFTTQRYRDYIEERDIHVAERRSLGTELKTGSKRFESQYEEFLKVLDENMSRKLRPQQARDAFFMLAMQKAGNFSVPGSGKTSSVLAVYCYLKQKGLVDRILVIGPKNCFKSWRDEYNVCFAGKEKLNEFNIQNSDVLKNTTAKKNYLQYSIGSHNVLMFNYDILGTYEEELIHIAKQKTLLVYDEVHRVKSVNGVHAVHALNIAKECNYTIALTGTPIPNSYRDLYNFLHILFPNEYNNFFNFSIATLDNPSDNEIEEINKSIQPFFCRTTKQQLFVPPPNEDIIDTFETNSSEQKLFEILCKKYRQNKLALFVRILQLESNPKLLLQKLNLSDFAEILDITDDVDDIDYIDFSDDVKNCIDSISLTTKKKRCIKLIKKLASFGKHVIVWCVFQNSIESLCSELRKEGISSKVIYGATEQFEREKILSEFKSENFQILITNPHTLAESVSLHDICHDAIYYEYSYNLVHLLQSKDRIHRLGLPDGQYTQYYYEQCWFTKNGMPFSLDQAIYNRLCEKEQTMLNAIDNNVLEKVTTPEEDVELIFKDLF